MEKRKIVLTAVILLVFLFCPIICQPSKAQSTTSENKKLPDSWSALKSVLDSDKVLSKKEIEDIVKSLGVDWDETAWGNASLKQLRSMGVDQQKASIIIIALLLQLRNESVTFQEKLSQGENSKLEKQWGSFKKGLDQIIGIYDPILKERSLRIIYLEEEIRQCEEWGGGLNKQLKIKESEIEELKKTLSSCIARLEKFKKNTNEESAPDARANKGLQEKIDACKNDYKNLKNKYDILLAKYEILKNPKRGRLFLSGGVVWGTEVYTNPYGALIDSWMSDPSFINFTGEAGGRLFFKEYPFFSLGAFGGGPEWHVGVSAHILWRYINVGGGVAFFPNYEWQPWQPFGEIAIESDRLRLSGKIFPMRERVQISAGVYLF